VQARRQGRLLPGQQGSQPVADFLANCPIVLRLKVHGSRPKNTRLGQATLQPRSWLRRLFMPATRFSPAKSMGRSRLGVQVGTEPGRVARISESVSIFVRSLHPRGLEQIVRRAKAIFASRFNADTAFKGLNENNASVLQNFRLSLSHPASTRGAFRDRHERWKRDAMDAKARATSAAIADGEIVWSCRPWAGAKSVDDDRQATVTMRSRTPGRART
jgi:hypothetical protein